MITRRCANCTHAKVKEQPVILICSENCTHHLVTDACMFSEKHQDRWKIGFKAKLPSDCGDARVWQTPYEIELRKQTLAEVVRSVKHLIREESYTCGEAEHILAHLKEMK